MDGEALMIRALREMETPVSGLQRQLLSREINDADYFARVSELLPEKHAILMAAGANAYPASIALCAAAVVWDRPRIRWTATARGSTREAVERETCMRLATDVAKEYATRTGDTFELISTLVASHEASW